MNWNQLRYVLTIAEEKSITRAAQRLYLTQPSLSLSLKALEEEPRPVKELAAFRRISLKAHEKKTIRCQIAASQLAFLDKNMKWKIEKGDVDILIGASSEDIRLRSNVHICEDAWIEGRNRAFYGKAEVL